MKKTYLLTPGPTGIPDEVRAELSRPVIHHRTPEFEKLFAEVQQGLKLVFQTSQDVIALASTGTGGMDAVVSNLFSPGEKVIVIDGGKFGARWSKIAKAYGVQSADLVLERGNALDLEVLSALVSENPDAVAILFQASETSTGCEFSSREITRIAHQAGMLSVCDAITAVGIFELPMDEWEIDVLIGGSQKAFMVPPGMAFVALSERAWKKAEQAKNSHFYFDLLKERQALLKNQTAWSPATTLFMALRVSLGQIQEETLPRVFARHSELARATRAAIDALGLKRLASASPSTAVTAVWVPSEIPNGKRIPKMMSEEYGVTIAGGQDELAGKIFRLSHFGYCGKFDITTAISCLELVLCRLGYPLAFGSGVGAALSVFNEGEKRGSNGY